MKACYSYDRKGLVSVLPLMRIFKKKRSNIVVYCLLKISTRNVSDVAINKPCFFNEQCENLLFQTECRDDVCACRFEKSPVLQTDGSVLCIGTYKTYRFYIGKSLFTHGISISTLLKIWFHHFFRLKYFKNKTHHHMNISLSNIQICLLKKKINYYRFLNVFKIHSSRLRNSLKYKYKSILLYRI